MKLHVLFDPDGHIVAAVRIDEHATASSRHMGRRLPGVRPVVSGGQKTAELEVPAEHSHLTFLQACRQLAVDTTQERPTLKRRTYRAE